MKKERVTGKAGINYKRTLDAVFFVVNAFFVWRRKCQGYAVWCYERKGYEGAIYGQDMNRQDVEEQEI